MKGMTSIPYARQAAELLMAPDEYRPDFNNRDVGFWARVVHFEMRYWSIDQLLEELPIKNVLELSSGFSFRGLERSTHDGVHYIDTDLGDVINTKKRIIQSLQPAGASRKGTLELLPLNALDEEQFSAIVERFPRGELVVVNEGLLMYLDDAEKKKLCGIIHNVLKKRGGYWITGDVYLSKKTDGLDIIVSDREKEFFTRHRIEENKFADAATAEKFFRDAGFLIDKEATTDRSKVSTLGYLLRSASLVQLLRFRRRGKIQATWRLRISLG